MATAKGQFEVDPIDGDAVNYQAEPASGAVRVTADRSGDRIILRFVNGADGFDLTFHGREELYNFIQTVQKLANI